MALKLEGEASNPSNGHKVANFTAVPERTQWAETFLRYVSFSRNLWAATTVRRIHGATKSRSPAMQWVKQSENVRQAEANFASELSFSWWVITTAATHTHFLVWLMLMTWLNGSQEFLHPFSAHQYYTFKKWMRILRGIAGRLDRSLIHLSGNGKLQKAACPLVE